MIEQKSSTLDRAAIEVSLGTLVMRYQDAVQAYDELVGAEYGLNSTDQRCLSALIRGPAASSEIARVVNLTPAAVTALVDRLERRGFVRRLADPADRRRVLVEATEQAHAMARDAYGPLAAEGKRLMSGYSTEELAVIERFLVGALAVQQAASARRVEAGKREPL